MNQQQWPHQRAYSDFLRTFLTNDPAGAIKSKMLECVKVIQATDQAHDPQSAHERKIAKQRLRRLIHAHPGIAAELVRQRESNRDSDLLPKISATENQDSLVI